MAGGGPRSAHRGAGAASLLTQSAKREVDVERVIEETVVKDATPGSPTEGRPMMALLVEPGKKKKKKKRKDSMFIRGPGKLLLANFEAMAKIGDAISSSSRKYAKKHRRSKDKKKDGWLKDLNKNLASAYSDLVTRGSKSSSTFTKVLFKKDKKRKRKDKDKVKTVILQPLPAGSSPVINVES